jgi:protein-L-isoaspartate(D-aspartate) O-methyltransferase
MLGELRRLGIEDARVLEAMDQVPRHAFVERFWRVPPSLEPSGGPELQEYRVTDESSDTVLAQVYDASAAILIRRSDPGVPATSSISAPVIVASMLSELQLEPGQRVLEIGTGSGYNAALLAHLLGDPALVTTVDIDPSLTTEAAERLRTLGYEGIEVRAGDGALGVPDRAPFDRIIATVGCVDLAPAWVTQLAPGGTMLVPLEHGAMHPRVLMWCDQSETRPGPATLRGRFVGRSGFVRVQGIQASRIIWPNESPPPTDPVTTPLPSAVAQVLDPSGLDRGNPVAARAIWNFAIYLAVRDRRASRIMTLSDESSRAWIRSGGLATHGSLGPALGRRLLEIAADWIDLGCPGLDRYALRFEPIPSVAEGGGPDSKSSPWSIDRIDYRQHLTLDSPAP